jgi:hypothetical protein
MGTAGLLKKEPLFTEGGPQLVKPDGLLVILREEGAKYPVRLTPL